MNGVIGPALVCLVPVSQSSLVDAAGGCCPLVFPQFGMHCVLMHWISKHQSTRSIGPRNSVSTMFDTWLGLICIICCFPVVLYCWDQLNVFHLLSVISFSLFYCNHAMADFTCVDTSSLNQNLKKTHLIIT